MGKRRQHAVWSARAASAPVGALLVGALLLGAALAVAAPATAVPAAKAATPPLRGFSQSTLDIETRSGTRHFSIYLAVTPAQQERGLMFVRKLPPATGMLFPLPSPREMIMWMKNTLIPLDMLFVGADGRIACLRARAVPESLDLIRCEHPVINVLELAGGEASRLGVAIGDQVVSPAPGSRQLQTTP